MRDIPVSMHHPTAPQQHPTRRQTQAKPTADAVEVVLGLLLQHQRALLKRAVPRFFLLELAVDRPVHLADLLHQARLGAVDRLGEAFPAHGGYRGRASVCSGLLLGVYVCKSREAQA